MHNNVAALIIESSSYNENKNVKHMITDTKEFKECIW